MKFSLLIVLLLLISCEDDQRMVKNVIVMSYVYEFTHENIWKAYPLIYSEINSEGKARIINRNSTYKLQGFQRNIPKEKLQKILTRSGKGNEDLLAHKFDSTKIDLYHGPIIRFKITFKDGTTDNVVIRDVDYDLSSVYDNYHELYKIILKSKNVKEKESNYKLLHQNENEFLKYARKRDSTNNEFPPPPNPDLKLIFLNQ